MTRRLATILIILGVAIAFGAGYLGGVVSGQNTKTEAKTETTQVQTLGGLHSTSTLTGGQPTSP